MSVFLHPALTLGTPRGPSADTDALARLHAIYQQGLSGHRQLELARRFVANLNDSWVTLTGAERLRVWHQAVALIFEYGVVKQTLPVVTLVAAHAHMGLNATLCDHQEHPNGRTAHHLFLATTVLQHDVFTEALRMAAKAHAPGHVARVVQPDIPLGRLGHWVKALPAVPLPNFALGLFAFRARLAQKRRFAASKQNLLPPPPHTEPDNALFKRAASPDDEEMRGRGRKMKR